MFHAEIKDQRRFFNLYIMGEDGLRDEFFEAIYHVGANIDWDSDAKAGMGYIELLQKAKRAFYDKKKTSDDVEEVEFKIISTEGKKLPVTEEDVKVMNDPESLYDSDEIIGMFDCGDD